MGKGHRREPPGHRLRGPRCAALPEGIHGRAITVASTLGKRAVADATAYCASKFGVVGFSHALAAETGGEIGVTTIIPGGMKTRFFDDRTEQYKPQDDSRLNDPANTAQAILFALSQPSGLRGPRNADLPRGRRAPGPKPSPNPATGHVRTRREEPHAHHSDRHTSRPGARPNPAASPSRTRAPARSFGQSPKRARKR